MIYVGIDTETTDLLKPILTPLLYKPYIIEIAIVLFDEKMNVLEKFDTLVKPPIEIPFFIEKHTGISNEMVMKKKPFKKHYKKVKKIIEKADLVFGQNVGFDINMVLYEFARLKKHIVFPKPFCCIEQSMHIKGRRLKNSELYLHFTGNELKNAHRALNDVFATKEVFKCLI